MRAWATIGVLWLVTCTAEAQVVTGSRFLLTTGACSVRSGSGVPATSLGAACDVYVRTDSPYGVYHKLDATTWVQSSPGTGAIGDLYYGSSATAFGRLAAVASGQVLASAGAGTAPTYTANPTVSTVTATGSATGFIATSDNAQLRLIETDGATDNQWWVIRAQNEQFAVRALDAGGAGTSWLTAERTGSAVDNVTLSPSAGDIILAPGGLDILPDVGYTKNLGALTNKYLTLHAAELWVETLVAQDTMATIGGRILVGPTTTLTSDLSSGATSMSVKHNNLLNGDRVVLQVNGSLEWMAIASSASGSGPYTYTITRNLDGSGANAWTAGDAVFNTGTTGNGFIDLYSLSGVIPGSTAGPTIVGNVRTGTTYSQIAPRWAIGNLNGTFGYGATTYGAAFGDSAATHITIDATNGIRMIGASGTKFSMDASGNATFAGRITVGTGRNLLSNTEFLRGRGAGDAYRGYWGGSSSTTTVDPSATYTCAIACSQRAVHGSGWSWLAADEDTSGSLTIGADAGAGPLGGNSTYFTASGTPANGTYGRVLGPVVPVNDDGPYEYSAYVAMSGAWTVNARIVWYGADGGDAGDQPDYISETNVGTTCTTGSAGADLGTWCRVGGIVTPASAARLALLAVIAVYDGGDATPGTYVTRPYFGEAAAGQTDLTPWAPGGSTLISGDMLQTDVVISNTLRSAGATALTTGTGYWLDATGTPTFRVGNPSGNRVSWDGTNLTLISANATIDSSGVTLAPATSGTYASDRAFRFSAATGNFGVGAADYTNNRILSSEVSWTGAHNASLDVVNRLSSAYQPSSGGGANGNAEISLTTATDFAEVVISAGTGATRNVTVSALAINLNGSVTFSDVPVFTQFQLTNAGGGSATALPANPVGYIIIDVGGTEYVVPVYTK